MHVRNLAPVSLCNRDRLLLCIFRDMLFDKAFVGIEDDSRSEETWIPYIRLEFATRLHFVPSCALSNLAIMQRIPLLFCRIQLSKSYNVLLSFAFDEVLLSTTIFVGGHHS